MKRLILLTALLLSFGTLRAATSTLANAQVLIDPATGLLLSIPTSGSSGGGFLGVSVKASVALAPTGMTAYTALSQTATSVNLTASAGASVPCMACLSSNGGAAAGFKVQFTTSATAPVGLTSSSQGHYIAASASAQCWGPFAPGTILHAAGVAASSSILVDVQKVQ